MAVTRRGLIRPMPATPGPLPTVDSEWAYELKWDGVRAVAYVGQGPLQLLSRTDQDMTSRYPELTRLGDTRDDLILDGELVTLLDGKPSFSMPAWYGGSADVLASSQENGLEGVVAKRLASTYQPGRRSRDWIKTKNIRMQEVIIGGWTEGQGRRTGAVGALLLGVHDHDGLRYVGQVGTGFAAATLADLRQRLTPLQQDRSPFTSSDGVPREHARNAHWVRPEVVGEVAYAEWTHDDILRHPSWRGYRPDKQPEDVHRD